MNVRALHIIDWADSREAQDQLPALVRRLIHATAEVESIFFASGESVSRPGVDGRLDAKDASPWVPGGRSVWEMGCDQSPGSKAARDYEGRRDEADAGTAFVFVTPRRWRGKQEWATSKQAEGLWRDVVVLDADDLEQWIERAPGVGIWLSEKLGIAGPGIHSPEHWWDRWSGQTRPAITPAAIFTGRDTAQAELVRHLQSETPFVGIRGDSAEEAAAFACVTLIDAQRADRAAIVSDVDAYRWIDANPGLSIVIAATPEIGSEWRPRDGVKLIVPSNPSRAGRTGDETRSDVALPRILRHDFEQALVELGHDPADAARLSRNTGRSWSIYRRVEACNPALAHPAWLDRPAARSLTTLCLVGAWISSESGDTAIVERIAGRAYADIERELRELATADDSPVLRIGDVWMALSPIELLHLVGPRITSDELDRYYHELEEIFSERDPVLDLAADQRWSAAIYGKKRTASGLVIDGMGDSLVKLSVVGDVMEALTPARPSGRAALLVRRLLSNADRDRWLSLANVLRELAEAAPEEYLLQLEAGIRGGDDGPAALIRETGRAGPGGGGCWHADLLWSLELLAWSPRRLVKVASLLAALSDTPVAGNWANTPMAALVSLFRPWWPQTAADERARIAAIDRVIERYPEQCWTLLNELSTGGGSFASPNAHPQWRTDDLGHTRPLRARSFNYEHAIRTRTIALAGNRADRLADLLRELRSYNDKDQAAILDQAEAFIDKSDADRELLRAALRKYLWWEHSFNGTGEHGGQRHLDRAEQIYRGLAPGDLIVRHAWLFAGDWIEPPEGNSLDDAGEALADRLRKTALAEIMDKLGSAGLMALARASAQPQLVGWTLAKHPEFEIGTTALLPLIEEPDANSAEVLLLRGYFNGLTDEKLAALVASLETMPKIADSNDNFINLLLRLPPSPLSWERADQASAEVRGAYWRQMFPRPGRQPEEAQFVLRRLMEYERPRTALALAQFKPGEADPDLLLDMLRAFGSGQEPDGPMLDYWRIDRIIKVLEENEAVDRIKLATMEWALYPLLKHGRETPRVLAEQLVSHAELFTQLMEIAFPKASEDTDTSNNDEASKALARERSHNAYWLLQSLSMLPGTDRQGRIDAGKFRSWIEAVRQHFQDGDQAKLADDLIGAILAHSPDGTDEHWPHELVRDVIELPDADIIREGFLVGVRNNRGVTTRAYNEGGDQERRLSAKYETRAAAIADAWPETAELLRKLADAYMREADREDEDARLRIER